MSHIFGLAHSFSGIVDQVTGIFSPAPTGLGFVPNPNGGGGVVDADFGAGVGTTTPMATSGGGCAPCGPKTKRYITTVCPDGSTTIREAKSRRRKRRLASMSDIKDLAALKNILGGGKAFDTWIATRGR